MHRGVFTDDDPVDPGHVGNDHARRLADLAADEFYVVQDAKTKKCTIVDKKPTESSMTVVSPSGTVYKTRTEAETGMKTVKVCTSQ